MRTVKYKTVCSFALILFLTLSVTSIVYTAEEKTKVPVDVNEEQAKAIPQNSFTENDDMWNDWDQDLFMMPRYLDHIMRSMYTPHYVQQFDFSPNMACPQPIASLP